MMMFFTLTSLVLVGALAWAPKTLADDTFCPPASLLGVTVDNVIVENGGCTISDATIEGDIKVLLMGQLLVTDFVGPVNIGGNVQGDGGSFVRLIASTPRRVRVEGDVRIKGTDLESGLINTTVGGNVRYEENSGPLIAEQSLIGGDLQMVNNTGGGSINNTNISGNLQCKENEPAPTGGNNIAGGNKEDQCAGF